MASLRNMQVQQIKMTILKRASNKASNLSLLIHLVLCMRRWPTYQSISISRQRKCPILFLIQRIKVITVVLRNHLKNKNKQLKKLELIINIGNHNLLIGSNYKTRSLTKKMNLVKPLLNHLMPTTHKIISSFHHQLQINKKKN